AENGDYTVAIVDLQGRELAAQNLTGLNGSQLVSFPVAELAKGSYMVRIASNGVSETRSVVIR
ncbi:MAG: T9SS type A sorting domain-containing protein, partial [Bacteroidota bacterium]